MTPSNFVFLSSLPLTPNGKVDRRALLSIARSQEYQNRIIVPPRTPVEATVMEVFSKILGAEQLGVYDDFFQMGGDSLMGTKAIFDIRETFQVEIPIRKFFEGATVANLARLIDEMILEEVENISDEEARRLL